MNFFSFCIAFALSFAATTIGCGSGPTPMSVKMVHPGTRQTLTCSASDKPGRSDTALLASAVDNCVKSLKARGFEVKN